MWLHVIMATSQLVTRSSRHTVNLSPVNSSHTRLITQLTRHMIIIWQCITVLNPNPNTKPNLNSKKLQLIIYCTLKLRDYRNFTWWNFVAGDNFAQTTSSVLWCWCFVQRMDYIIVFHFLQKRWRNARWRLWPMIIWQRSRLGGMTCAMASFFMTLMVSIVICSLVLIGFYVRDRLRGMDELGCLAKYLLHRNP